MILLLLALLAQDLPPQDAARRMRPADGFEVAVVAHEPAVRQPVAIDFDERGRLWVLQYLQYPTPAGLNAVKVDEFLRTVYDRVPEPPPKGPKGADRLTILEDADGDGVYEKAKDFVAGLNLASGFCIGRGGVYVAQSPYLLFYPDKDRDDVPDGDPKVCVSGFGMEDAHAFPNSLQWGPDGWLYGAQGSTVTAKIGDLEFQQGIWRWHPRTERFELFAEGGGNTWGLDFDRRGAAIAGTNFGAVAMLHQLQGAYYLKGFSKHGPLHNPHSYGYFEHVPYTGFKGGHVTCGGVIYRGGAFPAEYDGKYLAANPLSNDLYVHRLEPDGSTYQASHAGELLIGNDPWFRPVDLVVGPDGALYVADWHDKRLNHVDPRDNWDRTNGRVFRIAPKGLKPHGPFDLATKTPAELIELLSHPNDWWRRQARRRLAESGEVRLVLPLLDRKDDLALQALWTLLHRGISEDLAIKLLSHPHEDVRTWAVRRMGEWSGAPYESRARNLAALASDPSPHVVAQLACSAKRLAGGVAIAAEIVKRDDLAKDPFIPMLVWWAIEAHALADTENVMAILEAPAAWERPMIRDVVGTRIARRFLAEEDWVVCKRILDSAPRDARGPVVRGFNQALEGRRLAHAPQILELQARIMLGRGKQDPEQLTFAFRLGLSEAQDAVMKAAADPAAPEPLRLRALELLSAVGADAVPALLDAAGAGSDKVRLAALGSLQAVGGPAATSGLIERFPALPPSVRARARQVLLARPASALETFKAVEAGRIPKEHFRTEDLRTVAPFNDDAVNSLIAKIWGAVPKETAAAKKARIGNSRVAVSRLKGNPDLGRASFLKLCAPCHTLFGEGGKVAPDLTGADRKNLDYLLTNIIDPSAMIRPEFAAHQVLTSDGQVLIGLAVEQSPSAVTLVDAQTTRHVIPRDRIQAMKASELSLMPEGLIDPLDDQQTADLVAYLRSDGAAPAAPPQPGPLRVCLVSGSLEYESDASLAALQEHLEKTYHVQCTRAFRRTDEDLPGLEALESADVMLLFTRRLKPSAEQLDRIKKYVAAGKPVVGVRTASHAFQSWLELDKEVLGGSYSNHFGKGPDCALSFTEKAKGHPILEGVTLWTSKASLYKNPSNAADTETLLMGSAGGKTEPVAWTRTHHGGRVFYTSLGDQDDFKDPNFVRMIANALHWAAKRAPERKQSKAEPLPGTAPLVETTDFAEAMVSHLNVYLSKKIEHAAAPRPPPADLDALRRRLRERLGVVDERSPSPALERGAVFARGRGFDVSPVRWNVFRGITGEGLLLEPTGRRTAARVIALPDADYTPEQLAGLVTGVSERMQYARSLAEQGAAVVVPTVLDRTDEFSSSELGKATNQPHREFVYRPAFLFGRTVIGYEVQRVLALVDALGEGPPVTVVGYGEGGLIAYYAAALDPRLARAYVSGYFNDQRDSWKGPIYRSVFGLLPGMNDRDLLPLFAHKPHLEIADAPPVKGPPEPRAGRSGAAPGEMQPISLPMETPLAEVFVGNGARGVSGKHAAAYLLDLPNYPTIDPAPVTATGPAPDARGRQHRQLRELLEDTQVLLRRSERVRDAVFWKKLDLRSIEAFEASTAPWRDVFHRDVIGKLEIARSAPSPRSRLVYDEPTYRGYEVVLDVEAPHVFAYGLLLVPKDLRDGERRPVVVCQHGLEGRPQDLADPRKDHPAYHNYANRLAERGFVVFAPQNPYLGKDRFRTLQRQANLLGLHLFSIIVEQHRAITDWLAGLPFVDPERIAFYGLSYGGKTAMRVPALVKRYCLSICSADFNEWVWKNAALDSPYSYVTTGEYEIFEWNLGHTFNYAEMAALIAPRPFMVERGHDDGVAPDERVAYEYAKVRRLYAKLGIPERTEIEFFNGPHTIRGVGTFKFLHRHLRWPEPR